MCFRIYFLGSMTLIAVASWYLYSAAIVIANQAAEGTRLEKPINHLHSLAMEVNSAVTATFLFPSTLFKSYHESKGDPNGRPILGINGYLSFGSTWDYQRERQVKAGCGPFRTMNVSSGTSIITKAREIQKAAQQFKKDTGRNDMILESHSTGGLDAVYYATHFAEEDGVIVTDIVMIASPLAGTPASYFGLGYEVYEMRPGSDFTKDLQRKIEEYSRKIRFWYIASDTDLIVPLSSALSGAEDRSRRIVIKDIGHLGLIFSSRVADYICICLELSKKEELASSLA
jgi:hypothetical protein